MKTTKAIFTILISVSFLLPFFAGSIHAADYPIPFEKMKEVVLAQGEKDNDGTIVLRKQANEIEYYMIYFPNDGSIGFGKATSSGSYSWGILYDTGGKFVFLETFLGQLVNLYLVEAAGAIEVANQFVTELDALAGNGPGSLIKTNLIKI